MKDYKSNPITNVQAIQFSEKTKDKISKDLVRLCRMNYEKEIVPVPRDLLGTPKDAFFGFKNGDIWEKIQEGDWIVKKNDEYLLIPNGVFKLLFQEII